MDGSRLAQHTHSHHICGARPRYFLFLNSLFCSCCHMIFVNLTGPVPTPLVPASLNLATSRTHSARLPPPPPPPSHPRGPQAKMSDRWWAAIRRRHCTAAKHCDSWVVVVVVVVVNFLGRIIIITYIYKVPFLTGHSTFQLLTVTVTKFTHTTL